MNILEKLKTQVWIHYDNVYDDFNKVDPNTFLKNVPTKLALGFILIKQNEAMRTLYDSTQGKGQLEGMKKYMNPEGQDKIDFFIRDNEW